MDSEKINSVHNRFIPHKLLELLDNKDIAEIELGENVEKNNYPVF